MDRREPSEAYSEVGMELIRTEESLRAIADSQATIVFLASDQEKRSRGRTIFGECEKVPEKWKWAVPCDFTITVFEPNVERFTDGQIRILLFHELLHVGIEVDGNEERYFVVPHDYEEFAEIERRYGLGWSE